MKLSPCCIIDVIRYRQYLLFCLIRELPTGKGFADFTFIPRANAGKRPAMVIELKYDKTADTAITQIKKKRYTGALKDYNDDILLVGINYDKVTKKHTCTIE